MTHDAFQLAGLLLVCMTVLTVLWVIVWAFRDH